MGDVMYRWVIVAAIALLLAPTPRAASKPICHTDCLSMDFIMCSVYSKLLAKSLNQNESKTLSIKMMSYHDKFLGYAIKIGELEGHSDVKTYEAAKAVYDELEHLLEKNLGFTVISNKWSSECRKAVQAARELHSTLFPE
jgi:hypothetical protein